MSEEGTIHEAARKATAEASAITKIGIGSTIALGLVEVMPTVLEGALDVKEKRIGGRPLAFAAATAAIGIGLYALYKHTHAESLQAHAAKRKLPNVPASTWVDRVTTESTTSDRGRC